MSIEKTRALALLAPVPEKHLITALDAINQQYDTGEAAPIVAFGSSDFEVFRQADQLRGDRAIEVFIYASMSEQEQPLNPLVTWRGLYVGHVPSRSGRYPGKAIHRPSSTKTDKPVWAVYWQLQELTRLDTPILIGMFQGFKQKKRYEKRFIPKGPLLVDYP